MGGGGLREGPAKGGPAGGGVVLLCHVPVRLFLRLGHHVDELSRELEVLGDANGRGSPGAELLGPAFRHLIDLTEGPRRSALERAEAAAHGGAERFDLQLRLPRAAANVTHELVAVLEQADELSRHDELLTMPAPEEVVALRRWIADELEAQLIRGDPPRPCPL